ncbi:hypothetical protein CHR53_13670 [Neobacillus mesonae]|uniref:Uncharacterized protein n=1 Tax=Neobacillus mesonae TaxID=1193713 RepID=A0A3T0HZ43_9BACI|nr:hypothetical protein CHR53_13670 [Neobacillus mesonae]
MWIYDTFFHVLSLKKLSFPKENIRPLETDYSRHIALALPSLNEASRLVQLLIQNTKELFD